MNPDPIVSIEPIPDTVLSWLSPPEPRRVDVRPALRVPSAVLAQQLRDILPRSS